MDFIEVLMISGLLSCIGVVLTLGFERVIKFKNPYEFDGFSFVEKKKCGSKF